MRCQTLCVLAIAVVGVAAAASAQADYVSEVQADHPFEFYRMQETGAYHGLTAANSGTTAIAGMYQQYAGWEGSFTDVTSMTPALTPGKQFNRDSDTVGASIALAAQGSAYGALSAFTIEFLLKPANYDVGIKTPYSSNIQNDPGTINLNLLDNSLNLWVGGNTLAPGVDIHTAVPAGTWAHVAVTYEAGVSDSLTKFYVNGTLLNPGGSSGGGIGTVNFNTNSAIGYWIWGGSRYFDGAMDEFAVYNTALSVDRIAAHASMVPEPGTLVLFATGLIGLLCYAWRKRRR